MKKQSFSNFVKLQEGSDGPKATSTDRKLEKGQEFIVDRSNNSVLVPVIKAFNESGNVRVGDFISGGYNTVKGEGGTEDIKLKRKSLYLVGGAVRDHMLGKKPKDLDLATDATPSEIRMILLSQGFTETEGTGGAGKKSNVDNIKPPKGVTQDKNKQFYAKGWDREGSEFVIGIRIGGGEEMELATFREDSKSGDGRTPDKMSFSDLAGDAGRRDFTINAMYIKLDNADGANGKLHDPHGGLTHMSGGKGNSDVLFVGKASDRLEEDQLRAFRYVRFYSKYGKGTVANIPPKYKEAIETLVEDNFKSVSKERARDEFLKGLEDSEIDPKKYIRLYRDLGFLKKVFPGMTFKLDGPEDIINEKDRLVSVAWILRDNDIGKVTKMLNSAGWPNTEVKAITWLMNSSAMDHEDGKELMRMHANNPWPGEYANDGGRLERWSKLMKRPSGHTNALRDLMKSKMPSVYDDDDNLHQDFADLRDPISGQVHGPSVGNRKQQLVAKMYGDFLGKHSKLNM